MRRFIDRLQQRAFVIRINRQRLFESAGRNIKLLAVSRAERFRAFRHENAVHSLALRTVRRDAITVRQISIIAWNHPAVGKFDVALFGEALDLFQIAVVEPFPVPGEPVLRDPNHIAGSQRDAPRFIDLKTSGLVQVQKRRFRRYSA